MKLKQELIHLRIRNNLVNISFKSLNRDFFVNECKLWLSKNKDVIATECHSLTDEYSFIIWTRNTSIKSYNYKINYNLLDERIDDYKIVNRENVINLFL